MRTPHRFQISTALGLVLILAGVVPATAQYKNSTPIPPSIPAPDKVETPFGTVHLDDGFPDKESADKIYDMLDYQRAVQGYLLGLAAVSQYANRQGMAGLGAPNSTVNIYVTTTRRIRGFGLTCTTVRWFSKFRPRCSVLSMTCGTTGWSMWASRVRIRAKAAST